MNFIKSDTTDIINTLRTKLYQRLAAPIDAMWEKLYIGSSQHYMIEKDTNTIGYCCIDNNDSLVQIFLIEEYIHLMNTTITTLIEAKLIRTASLSSNEPVSFNTCLLHSNSLTANTFCFQYTNRALDSEPSLNLQLVSEDSIPQIKSFLKYQIGFDDTFGYTENLVERQEIYMLKESNTIIATSELRLSDSQNEIADLGVIINKEFRGQGFATKVLQQQARKALSLNRKPICSTTFDNIASQKAIVKAGFYNSNIIFNLTF